MENNKSVCIQPNDEHLKVLREYFGHNKFKSEQWDVIRAIVYEKRDCFIIAGTGFGKSLIYQFPPIFMHKIAIIISPLISLMQDQVLALQRKQINACLLGSVQKNANIDLRRYRVIYLTPEYLDGSAGREKLETIQNKVCVVAIDECHCITQWGISFRPKYRKLFGIKSMFPSVPVVSLTATATQHCIQDVCQNLQLKDPLIIRAELNRPNLQLFAFQKSESFIADVKKYVASVKSGAMIVYVLKRKETVEYSEMLNQVGFNSRAYHAGMKDKERHEVLKEFTQGKLNLIVATIAFGMGIDRADVRLVIHYGMPKNVESYLQESGRAGRDGASSKCIIFWSERDINFHYYWLNVKDYTVEYKEHCKRLLEQMKDYLLTNSCRRMKILRYFVPSIQELPIHEQCCDNCVDTLHKTVPLYKMYKNVDRHNKIDVSSDARLLLRLVKSYRGKCSIHVLKLFIGKVPTTRNQNHSLELFSKGKLKQEAWWMKLLQILLNRNVIKTKSVTLDSTNDLRVTYNGMKLLRRTSRKLTLIPDKNILEFLEKTNTEFFIEQEELKSKPRKRPMKTLVNEKTMISQDLFNFGVSAGKKLPEKIVENENSSSTSYAVINKPEDEESEDEDDYYLENTKLNFEMSRRPMKVELDDFLSFLENYDECRFTQVPETESFEENMEKVEDIDISRFDFVANCSLKIALKRLGEHYEDLEKDEEEVPYKRSRFTQET